MQEDDISLDLQCNDFSFMCGLLLPEIENDTQIPSPTEVNINYSIVTNLLHLLFLFCFFFFQT